ncbi:MarR family winged helix-turn-helix transcriptional regulator [Merdimonas faecis]|uniref:MarR family winged helix-turn-helix transcriptional regulator n=1 Tax=Merdimonas faecis TaxID=1653435 RepID=UPI0022E49473|nr:MarR family transcriptional regulator [Merdimonas faecis]
MGKHAGKWINRVSHQLKRQMLWPDEPGDLTILQKSILHFILFETMQRDLYQKDLEKEFKVRRSTASENLRLLEKKGYLYRECAKEDARLKKIIPTEKAVCLRGQLLKSIERTEERIRQGIPEEDLKVFFRVLKQISANLSSWEEENKMGKEEIEG